MKYISSQNLTGKYNRIKFITEHREEKFSRTNIWENRSIFNQTIYIQEIEINKISLPTKLPTPYHIGDVVKITLRSEWYHSTLTNYEKMSKSITLSAPFLRSSIPPDTKILDQRISFKLNKKYINNKYDLYSGTCEYGSSMLEYFDFTVSHAPVAGIISLRIISYIASSEGLIIFVLDIYNAFKNNFLPNH